MTQKLLIMERDTKEELQKAIKKNVLQADNYNRISAISIVPQIRGGLLNANKSGKYFEAWIILEVPENKDRLYDLAAGFEST